MARASMMQELKRLTRIAFSSITDSKSLVSTGYAEKSPRSCGCREMIQSSPANRHPSIAEATHASRLSSSTPYEKLTFITARLRNGARTGPLNASLIRGNPTTRNFLPKSRK